MFLQLKLAETTILNTKNWPKVSFSLDKMLIYFVVVFAIHHFEIGVMCMRWVK